MEQINWEKVEKALQQGYIWVKNDYNQVFKSHINGLITTDSKYPHCWCFIKTYEDREINPPRLQEYDFRQDIDDTNWALTKEELEPYEEEIDLELI